MPTEIMSASALADKYIAEQEARLGPISHETPPIVSATSDEKTSAITWPSGVSSKACVVYTFVYEGQSHQMVITGSGWDYGACSHHVTIYRVEKIPMLSCPDYAEIWPVTHKFADAVRAWSINAGKHTVRAWRGKRLSGWMRRTLIEHFIRDFDVKFDHVET